MASVSTRLAVAAASDTLGGGTVTLNGAPPMVMTANCSATTNPAITKAQVMLRDKAMANGATLVDPNTVYLSYDTELGQDVVVEPNVVFGPKVKVGNNVVGVALMTCLIAIIGHLDGGGASTFLITIPAMLPVYKRLHMRRETLLLICVTAMGVMNLMPWGGPTMRAANVIEMEPNDLWFQLMPMQIVGLVLAVGTAIFWGLQEKKRIAKLGDAIVAEDAGKYDDSDDGKKDEALARPQNFIFNVILTLAVIIVLVLDIFPSYYVFMVGCALGILVNYRGKKLHNSIIKSHASAGLSMASTILCAGVFLGVLSKSGIMEKMAVVMASFIPASLGRFLPIIIGILSVPLALLFDTDSYFYGLLPVLVSVGNQFGVNPAHIAIAMVVCRNCATFISPVAPATYLGIGLAGVEIKDHIKYCFGWQWGVSIVCLVAGLILGVIHF